MPIAIKTPLNTISRLISGNIAAYNARGTRTEAYNAPYSRFIEYRSAGLASEGKLSAWILTRDAALSTIELLTAFGMSVRNSSIVPLSRLQEVFARLNPLSADWTASLSLPLPQPPAVLFNPATQASLADEIRTIYNLLALPGSVTNSGGYVAASKSFHCLFPNLGPIIDGLHSGPSYYHIVRETYMPPLGLTEWQEWLGAPMQGVPNPSPRGGGRTSWGCDRFLAALGINQHIYELWQHEHDNPGIDAFLALDPTRGTTGVPRIIDKVLW